MAAMLSITFWLVKLSGQGTDSENKARISLFIKRWAGNWQAIEMICWKGIKTRKLSSQTLFKHPHAFRQEKEVSIKKGRTELSRSLGRWPIQMKNDQFESIISNRENKDRKIPGLMNSFLTKIKFNRRIKQNIHFQKW